MSDINDINADNVNFGTQNFHAPVYFGGRSIEPPPKPNNKIFLSYARDDDDPAKSFLRRLYNDLKAAGYDVWWDRENMPSRGLTFLDEIRNAITECRRLILVVGEHAITSDYVKDEWMHALKCCIPVIPILRNGDYSIIPAEISYVHAPDFRTDEQYTSSLAELKRILGDADTPLATLYGVPGLPESYIERAAMAHIREALLQESTKPLIVSAQKQATALTVHGLIGIGKTTLTSALARSCEVRRAFPDGIFWMKIGKKTEDVISRMADIGAVFGDPREEYPDLTRAKQQLSALLAGKKALIVLDDVWNHEIVNHFRVSDAYLLVTTRQSGMVTKLDAHGEALETLTLDEGLRLIAQRLTKPKKNIYVSPADLPLECAEIVSFLEGHTLAVSLAAAKLDKRDIAYAKDLLDRLKQNRLFTDGDQTLNIDSEDKNLNLERSLFLSYEDLSDDLKRRWRALGVFAIDGTFDRDAVMFLWGDMDKYVTEDHLENLLDAGLIQYAEDNRFKQHSLLRAYAYALLSDQDEAHATAIRHFEHYETYHGESRDHINTDYLQSITPDVPNLQVAIHWGLDNFPERACHLLTTLDNFFLVYKHNLYQNLLHTALKRAQDVNYKIGIADIHRAIGAVHIRKDELKEANHYLEKASLFYRELLEQNESTAASGLARTLEKLGELKVRKNDVKEAQKCLEEALHIFKIISDDLGEGNTLLEISKLKRSERNREEAFNYCEKALKIYKAIPHDLGVANAEYLMGILYMEAEESEKAQCHYENALLIYESNFETGKANVLLSIGQLQANLQPHRFTEAEANYKSALEIYQKINQKLGIGNTYVAMGKLYAQMSHADQAEDYYKQAETIFTEISDTSGILNVCINLARLAFSQNNISAAKMYYERHFEITDVSPELKDHPTTQIARNEYDFFKQKATIQLHIEGGSDAVRDFLKDELSDNDLNTLIQQLELLYSDIKQILYFSNNTIKVKTQMPEELTEWRGVLQEIRADFAQRGEDWLVKVPFADALLAILDGQIPILPEDNPYSDFVKQVIDAIEVYRKDNQS